MTNLIDKTYFVADLLIPNIATETDVSDLMDLYIARYQKKILVDLLGQDLYLAFETGLAATSPEQKWLDLRDGKTYTIEYDGADYSIHWNGLVNDDKESLLAYFTYFYFVREKHVQLTGVGSSVINQENATPVLPNSKIIEAYNKGVDLYGQNAILTTLRADALILVGDTIPRILPISLEDKTKANAFNFITAMNDEDEDTYPNWIFKNKKFINNFGI